MFPFFRPLATAFAVALALPAFAQGTVTISDAYALASPAAGNSGAAFMVISNAGAEDDRLLEARSDAAQRVELHTHLMDANGVARMVEVKEGFAIPAGGAHALERGADHVMFMGLTEPFEAEQTVHVTLVFERAGELALDIPIVAARPGAGMGPGPMHGPKHGG